MGSLAVSLQLYPVSLVFARSHPAVRLHRLLKIPEALSSFCCVLSEHEVVSLSQGAEVWILYSCLPALPWLW